MPDDVRSLYRRYRSQTFGELIGQDHVSHTLLNALASGRIAHAYLFAGPRGSGKTSTARILAKAVNCLNNGGKGEPCNECEMCVAINDGRALDLIEIDAASNRGIDEIRDLRDKVRFAPTQARYKVYILDEAHMLTNEAFNALLKTLEEPPAHVIFALVTTEAHRIPPTILSRCQRFDFHRASAKDILTKLNHICQEEHLKVEPAALAVIARTATGSYRDAESLLDQLASFSGAEGITVGYLQEVLGLAPLDATNRLVACIARHDVSAGLKLLAEIMQGGADLRQFARDLVDYLRSLMLIKTDNEALLDTTPEAVEDMKAQAKLLSIAELVRLIKLFSDQEVLSGLRASAQPQLPLELAFIEACSEGGQLPASHSPAGAAGHTATATPPATTHPPAPARPEAPAPPPHTPPPHSSTAAPNTAPPSAARTAPAPTPPATRPAYSGSAAPASRPVSPSQGTHSPASGASMHPPASGGHSSQPPASSSVSAAARPSTPVAITAPPGSPLAQVQQYWPSLLEAVKNVSRSVEAFLKECRPLDATDDTVVLGFYYQFHRDSVDNMKNRVLVEEAFSKVLAHPTRIQCALASKEGQPATPPAGAGMGTSAAPAVARPASAPPPAARAPGASAPGEDPVVDAAKTMFHATVLSVEKTDG